MKRSNIFCLLPLLTAIIFSFSSIRLTGQNLKKFYYSTPTDEGTLYFVLPQELSLKSKTSLANKTLSYDFTFLSGKDSVRMLTTIITKQPLEKDALSLQTQQHTYHFPLNTIYKEIKKNMWTNRMELFISYALWKELFLSQTPFTITLQQGRSIDYSLSANKWKELQKKYEVFFQMIKLNSNKK